MMGSPAADPQPAGLSARLAAVLTPAVALKLADASPDGLALADADGALVLVNQRIEEMFGYDRAELLGSPLEHLITADPQVSHREQGAGDPPQPSAGPPVFRMRQSGLRKDGTTFPADISLRPLATETGELTVAVLRDVTDNRRRDDPAPATGAAHQEHAAVEFPDIVVTRLLEVGLALQAAADLPAHLVRQAILDAAARLDETIRETRSFVFAVRTRGDRPP